MAADGDQLPEPAVDNETETTYTTTRSPGSDGRKRAVVRPDQQNQPSQDSNDAELEFVDGKPEPTGFFVAGEQLVSSVLGETGKRATGMLNTATGAVKVSSGLLGMVGVLVREKLKNLHQVAGANFALLSDMCRSVKNGAVNVIGGAQEIGGEAGQALSDTLKSTTNLSKAAIQTSGTVVSAPIKMFGDGLKISNRVATIPPKVTGFVAKTTIGALSKLGVHGEEPDAEESTENPAQPMTVQQGPRQQFSPSQSPGGSKKNNVK